MEFLYINHVGFPLLSIIIFLPAISALIALVVPAHAVRWWALAVTVITAVLSLLLLVKFDTTTALYQFGEHHLWIPAINVHYTLGVDGISILLVLLTAFVMPLCVLASWKSITERVKEFHVALLLMEMAMIGVFCALDAVLFYLFWEAMLIPMFLLIAVWGGPRRSYAAMKFFIYTLVGSVLLLAAIIALYFTSEPHTFSIPQLMGQQFGFNFQVIIFLACAFAFAIKVPMFPFHTWLPAAHVEAPTAGSVILAGILLKMGGYGFLRFCLPITPLASTALMPYLVALSIVSIIYGGLTALAQSDVKKLVAYSSVGHMGFVTLGIFAFSVTGIEGAMLQMINHGITTGALFLAVGIIYERLHSRELSAMAGIGKFMPVFIVFLTVFGLSSMAFPGLNGFIGEFLVLAGAFGISPWVMAAAIPGAFLAAAYMLRFLQRTIWGGVSNPDHSALHDISLREVIVLAVPVLFVFWIGLAPKPLIDVMHVSAAHLADQVHAAASAASGTKAVRPW
ncbi:MAG: NADH-quinone oxidoreductase subunit M [Spirochaetes bacterium]|nr:NADH-quinone oxidoreductase subunit M [Spirochaetota bacterium]